MRYSRWLSATNAFAFFVIACRPDTRLRQHANRRSHFGLDTRMQGELTHAMGASLGGTFALAYHVRVIDEDPCHQFGFKQRKSQCL